MKEVFGNLWDFYDQGHWVAVTTNGVVTRDGRLVMGRGTALQAKTRIPDLERNLGERISRHGNLPQWIHFYRIVTFPVKVHWRDRAELQLIRTSAMTIADLHPAGLELYLPRPGCGNGGLSWDLVKPIIASILDDRFTVVELP